MTISNPISITVPNVPDQAIDILLRELKRHGAHINRPHVGYGEIDSDAGKMRFWHSINKVLTVEITGTGHMPRFLVVGSIKKYIDEAIEAARGGGGSQ